MNDNGNRTASMNHDLPINSGLIELFGRNLEQPFIDWLKTDFTRELSVSGLNTKNIFDYFSKHFGLTKQAYLKNINQSETVIFDAGSWVSFKTMNLLIQNAMIHVGEFSLERWREAGYSYVFSGVANLVLNISMLLPTHRIFETIQPFINRAAKHGIVASIDSKEGFADLLLYYHPSLKHLLLGFGSDYYIGCLMKLISKGENPPFLTDIGYRSVRLQNILTMLYESVRFEVQEVDDGLMVDGKLVAKKIRLNEETVNGYEVFNTEYAFNNSEPNALLVIKNIEKQGFVYIRENSIFNAPYTRFQIRWSKSRINLFRRLFYRLFGFRIYPDELNDYFRQLTRTERTLIQSHRHSTRLEEIVSERTQELELALKDAETARRDAELANKAKSDFLSKMSHELRTPMQGILGFSKLGVSRVDTVELQKLKEYFELINSSGARLLVLLNDLLDLSRLEAGKAVFHFEKEKLSHIVAGVLRELEIMIEEKALRVRFKEPDFDDSASLDIEKIMQVLRNLISNAVKFSPDNGEIRILVEPGYKKIVFTIEDNGVGIPVDELNMIFEKFTQSSKTASNAGGTGLGLAICSEIIRAHNGRIWAENIAESGASVKFWIPAA